MKKIISIAIVLCLVVGLAMYFRREPETIVWEEFTVSEGDTLCEISQSITPDTEDYRETQHYITEKNNLESAMIYPGQKLLIPCDEVETEETTPKSLGVFRLTAYCACSKCCGKSNGITASGVKATAGRTVAVDTSIPFGTILIIDGHEYVAEDRGGSITENRIDIFMESHAEALNFGVQYKEVFAG